MKIKLTSQLTLADCQRRTQFCFFFYFFGYGNGNRGDEHKTILLGRLTMALAPSWHLPSAISTGFPYPGVVNCKHI